MTELDKVFEFLGAININPAIREYAELEAIKEWAIDSLGLDYVPGDRVRICSDVPFEIAMEGGGWNSFKYALQRGQEGIAGDITFSTYHKKWGLLVSMDRVREVTTFAGRESKFWYGPREETPEGFEFIREEVHKFHMNVHWVQKARNR